MRTAVVGALSLCLLCVPLLRRVRTPVTLRHPPPHLRSLASVGAPRPIRTTFEAALRAGWQYRRLAHGAVKRVLETASEREREELEAWDPKARAGEDLEPRRRALLAADRGGDLRRARRAAERAAALARTPEETYRAAALLARIECDSGHHDQELRLARKLIALQPRNERSWEWLWHADICNRLAPPRMPQQFWPQSPERHEGHTKRSDRRRHREGAAAA